MKYYFVTFNVILGDVNSYTTTAIKCEEINPFKLQRETQKTVEKLHGGEFDHILVVLTFYSEISEEVYSLEYDKL